MLLAGLTALYFWKRRGKAAAGTNGSAFEDAKLDGCDSPDDSLDTFMMYHPAVVDSLLPPHPPPAGASMPADAPNAIVLAPALPPPPPSILPAAGGSPTGVPPAIASDSPPSAADVAGLPPTAPSCMPFSVTPPGSVAALCLSFAVPRSGRQAGPCIGNWRCCETENADLLLSSSKQLTPDYFFRPLSCSQQLSPHGSLLLSHVETALASRRSEQSVERTTGQAGAGGNVLPALASAVRVWEVQWEDIAIERPIGRGSFGWVRWMQLMRKHAALLVVAGALQLSDSVTGSCLPGCRTAKSCRSFPAAGLPSAVAAVPCRVQDPHQPWCVP